MQRQLSTIAILVGLVTVAGACAHRTQISTGSALSSDSLAAVIRTRFTVALNRIELRSHRTLIGLGSAPWADSSQGVQFARAYDVARLVWERHGAARGVDTVSVRTTFRARNANADASSAQEYFFYPEQLSSRDRPRLGATR
jgi:hypothetical protein